MKITGYESAILNIAEDDPLANMPEEAGRKRPIVTLRLRTDAGIEGIGVTLWGGRLSGSLRSAIDELSALIIGEDPLRIERIIARLRDAAGSPGGARRAHPGGEGLRRDENADGVAGRSSAGGGNSPGARGARGDRPGHQAD